MQSFRIILAYYDTSEGTALANLPETLRLRLCRGYVATRVEAPPYGWPHDEGTFYVPHFLCGY